MCKKKLVLLFCLLCSLTGYSSWAQTREKQQSFLKSLRLSAEEKDWVDQNYIVRVHPDTWPPFNYWDIKTGTNQGICVEYLRWIEQQTGIRFEYPAMWMPLKHILPALENKQLDMSPSLQKTPEREKYLIYSEEIIGETFSLFGSASGKEEEGVSKKGALRISCEEGSKTHAFLKEGFGNVEIVPTITEEDGLRKVISGEVDYHAGAKSVCEYLIRNYYGLGKLTEVEKLDQGVQGVYMAVRNDWPELVSIINKALVKFPDAERKKIADNYLHQIDWKKYKDYLFWGLAILVVVLSFMLFLLLRSMRRQKEQKRLLNQDDFKLQQASRTAGVYFLEFDITIKRFLINCGTARSLLGNAESCSFTLKEGLKLVYKLDRETVIKAFRNSGEYTRKPLKIRLVNYRGNLAYLNCYINQQLNKASNVILISLQDITRVTLFNTQLLSVQRLAHLGHFRLNQAKKQYLLSDEILRILGLTTSKVYFSAEEVMGMVSEEQQKVFLNVVYKAVEENKNEYKATVTYYRKDKKLYLQIIGNLLYNDHQEIVFHDGYVQDITELKEVEFQLEEAKNQAEQASRAKSAFLARMSHEIRTPLNVIIGMLNLTLKTSLTEKQLNFLSKSRTASTLLLNLINDILDFSKVEANKVDLVNQSFSLSACLGEIKSLMTQRAEEKGLKLNFNLEKLNSDRVLADELRLKQVLLNLVNNAVKFTSSGEIQVNIEEQSCKNGAVDVLFSVKDTGIGLSRQQQSLLFNSFMQVDESYVRKHEGTGLGLAICKRIVELWGGRIWLESELDKGSVFYFTFKAKVAGEEVNKELPLQEKHLIKTPKILLAEDNEFNQEIAYEIFQELGVQIDIAPDGIKAVEMASTKLYDIVFMDVHMPEADGITATRLIRKRLDAKILPIVAVTAYALNENKEMCLNAGMNNFISKPFLVQDIVKVLQAELPGFFSEGGEAAFENHAVDETTKEQQRKLIDTEHALQYLSTEDRLKKYLIKFNGEFDNRLDKLQQLKKEEKFEELRSFAHSIKGEAGYLGMKPLQFICEKVQQECFVADDKDMLIEFEKIFQSSFLQAQKLVER